MKRSEINRALKEMEAMVKEYRFAVPPFCDFTPEEWQEKGNEYDEIREICWAGTLRIMDWADLTRWDFL